MAGVLSNAVQATGPTSSGPTYGTGSTVPTPSSVMPGTYAPSNVTPTQVGSTTGGTAAPIGNFGTAASTNVNLAGLSPTGSMNPTDSTNAASQLSSITEANSPYIQQATQQGLLSAAGRGWKLKHRCGLGRGRRGPSRCAIGRTECQLGKFGRTAERAISDSGE